MRQTWAVLAASKHNGLCDASHSVISARPELYLGGVDETCFFVGRSPMSTLRRTDENSCCRSSARCDNKNSGVSRPAFGAPRPSQLPSPTLPPRLTRSDRRPNNAATYDGDVLVELVNQCKMNW